MNDRGRPLRWAAWLLLGAVGVALFHRPAPDTPATPAPEPAPQTAAPTPPPLPDHYPVSLEGADAAPAADRRVVIVDLVPVNGRDQRVHVTYDLAAVTRPTTFGALHDAPEWHTGVRLLLGEMGAWRLRESRWALLEAVGILQTVRNRFDPDLSNPLRIPGVTAWPGCGHGGSFATCVDPHEYLGLDSDRALRPRAAGGDPARHAEALDRAVTAWFLFEEDLLGEITAGATSFVHLCGGTGYGRSHDDCTTPGADPARGPILFRGPGHWLPAQGRYALAALAAVDFATGPQPTAPRALPDYLLAADAAAYGDAADRTQGR